MNLLTKLGKFFTHFYPFKDFVRTICLIMDNIYFQLKEFYTEAYNSLYLESSIKYNWYKIYKQNVFLKCNLGYDMNSNIQIGLLGYEIPSNTISIEGFYDYPLSVTKSFIGDYKISSLGSINLNAPLWAKDVVVKNNKFYEQAGFLFNTHNKNHYDYLSSLFRYGATNSILDKFSTHGYSKEYAVVDAVWDNSFNWDDDALWDDKIVISNCKTYDLYIDDFPTEYLQLACPPFLDSFNIIRTIRFDDYYQTSDEITITDGVSITDTLYGLDDDRNVPAIWGIGTWDLLSDMTTINGPYVREYII